jgi:hypothetical protein
MVARDAVTRTMRAPAATGGLGGPGGNTSTSLGTGGNTSTSLGTGGLGGAGGNASSEGTGNAKVASAAPR